MKFDWFDFNEEDFINAITHGDEQEDDIYGFVSCSNGADNYLIDIHFEHYNSKERGFEMEIYEELSGGGHGHWFGSTRKVRSAKTYKRFIKRAEKVLVEEIKNIKEM